MEFYELYNLADIQLGLAVEAHALLRGATDREVAGVEETREDYPQASATVTTITITSEVAARALGKKMGNYLTIESPALRQPPGPAHQELSRLLARKLRDVFSQVGITDTTPVLVIGLGNWQATPDSLGPKVIRHLFVTRHLLQYAAGTLPPETRAVTALAPGVLGTTGIETAEVIKGVLDHIRPDAVIAIDALAARSIERINSTIQIADSGIDPGSGIGNQRASITRDVLGVPVIALGVPTVVAASTIVLDALQALADRLPDLAGRLSPPLLQPMMQELLHPFGGQLSVTPKEIDDIMIRTARLIARGINLALYPNLSENDLNALVQE